MAEVAVAVLIGRTDVQRDGVAAIFENAVVHVVIAAAVVGGADEILDHMRLLTGGGHAHVFLRRPAKGRKALHSVR